MGQRQRVFTAPNGVAHPLQHHQATGSAFLSAPADEMGPASAGSTDTVPGGAAWEADWIDLGGEG